MVQLNLLPDIKLTYIKAQRARRMVLSVSVVIALATVALLIFMFSVGQLQKKHLGDLSDDIKSSADDLKGKRNVNRVLTVQNQLENLTKLHDQKPAAVRILGYMNQLTPTQVSITNLDTNFVDKTISISGTADSASVVNRYVDTLKLTRYSANNALSPAFGDVVLQSFALTTTDRAAGATEKPATFTINMVYDPVIFDTTNKINKLVIPNTQNSRSGSAESTQLFQAAPAPQGGN